VGTGGADWWYPNRLKADVAAGAVKGATFLAVADTKGLEVGQLCQVSLKNDPKLPVIVPGSFEYMRSQITRIVGKKENGILISPALQFDLPMSLAPRIRPTARTVEFVGIEDLAIDGAAANVQVGVGLTTGYGCWIRNVAVRNITNYHVSISDSLQCEIRHSTIATRRGGIQRRGVPGRDDRLLAVRGQHPDGAVPAHRGQRLDGERLRLQLLPRQHHPGRRGLFHQQQPRRPQQLQPL
jgi:hypothetical protein